MIVSNMSTYLLIDCEYDLSDWPFHNAFVLRQALYNEGGWTPTRRSNRLRLRDRRAPCHRRERWPRSAGQVGGEDKLSPGSGYAASFRLDAVVRACPNTGVEPIPKYASPGVRPASAE